VPKATRQTLERHELVPNIGGCGARVFFCAHHGIEQLPTRDIIFPN
jgi:hypothetical protein